jgi:predicted DNA-binding transcriptional regulator YafY
MFNQNRIYRVFQLITYLKAKPAKSVKSVMEFLDTSERTVYRYLDMLKDLGFKIERDNGNRIWINTNGNTDIIHFTNQEADYLEKLIKTTGKSNKLVESVLQKVRLSSELEIGANLLFKAHLGHIVEQISIAIIEGRQLLIKNYISAHSQTISDRIVEPMCFTDDYESVSAFEVKTKQNKYFNIERMAEVEVLDSKMKYEKEHEFYKPDIFGYQGKSLNKEKEIQMCMRAAQVLKEEYPMSVPYIKSIPESDRYYFMAKVQSFQAPGRFVLGFLEDVKVVGSKDFIRFINRIVKKKI